MIDRRDLDKWLKESAVILEESLNSIPNREDSEYRWKLEKANRKKKSLGPLDDL